MGGKCFPQRATAEPDFCREIEMAADPPKHDGVAGCTMRVRVVSRAGLPVRVVYGEARVSCALCHEQPSPHGARADRKLPCRAGRAAYRMGLWNILHDAKPSFEYFAGVGCGGRRMCRGGHGDGGEHRRNQKALPCAEFPDKNAEGQYPENVILDFDYWAFAPRHR